MSELLNVKVSAQAGCVDTSRSINGYVYMKSDGPVFWQARQ